MKLLINSDGIDHYQFSHNCYPACVPIILEMYVTHGGPFLTDCHPHPKTLAAVWPMEYMKRVFHDSGLTFKSASI